MLQLGTTIYSVLCGFDKFELTIGYLHKLIKKTKFLIQIKLLLEHIPYTRVRILPTLERHNIISDAV